MKRRRFIASSLAAGCSLAAGRAVAQFSAESPIEDGAELKQLATGFIFLEGPCEGPDGSIYLCEFRRNKMYVLSPDGEVRLLSEDSGGTSGLYYDHKGRLIGAGSRARALQELHPDGTWSVIVDNYGGKRFNAPNDVWAAPDGGVYFSDPDWERNDSELGGGNVFYLSPDRKRLFPAVGDFDRPNGVVGDPAMNRLYVINRDELFTYWFPINPDGSVGKKVLFAEAGRDGLTVDRAGNVYLTDEEMYVFDKNGRPAAIIPVPERPVNACFAGPDKKTLIITAETSVYAIRTKVAGY